MPLQSRRDFLTDTLMAASVALAGGTGWMARGEEAPQSTSPNEKLGIAVLGVRNRGGAHWGAFTARQDTEVLWVVDVDSEIAAAKAEEIARRQKRKPKIAKDMREAFADPLVDIVTVATPNHWHALASIWAMQHGKDVYVEKPVSHNVSEGRRIVDAARKYKRICQVGTQSRSMTGLREAMQFLHDGNLGEVKLAHGMCYKKRDSIGPKGNYPLPTSVDYDLWSGPAPILPVTRQQFHYDWHWQWPYGNGDLGNQGIHQMDVARWGLGLSTLSNNVLSYGGRFGYQDAGDTANTQVIIHDYGDKTLVFEVRGLKTRGYKNAPLGVYFEGPEATMVVASYDAVVFDKDGRVVKKFGGGTEADHYDNFVRAVRSRKAEELHADILDGHLSSALCHLGNISYRLGSPVVAGDARRELESLKSRADALDTFDRTMQHLEDNGIEMATTKLQWGQMLAVDAAEEKFCGNAAADAMLTRDYRAPFVVPTLQNL